MFVILPPFFTPLDYCYSNAMLVDFFFNLAETAALSGSRTAQAAAALNVL